MKRAFFLMALVLAAKALDDDEAAKFSNSGAYCGKVQVTDNGDSFTIVTNGVPDHEWEDVNPHDVIEQSYTYEFPKTPTDAATPGCLPGGALGIAINGVPIYNPLTSKGINAVEGTGKEMFDKCDGHPDAMGRYHYHKMPGNCVYKGTEDELLGVAIDGYPIYGPLASDLGRDLTSADLDECHGRMVGGKYRYHFTSDYPYTLGCLRGDIGDNRGRIGYNCHDAAPGEMCTCSSGQLTEAEVTVKKQLRSLLDLVRDTERYRRDTGEMVEVIDDSPCAASTDTETDTETETDTVTTTRRPRLNGGRRNRTRNNDSRKTLIKKAVMDMLEFLERELDEEIRGEGNETSGEDRPRPRPRPDGNDTSSESKEDRPKPTGDPIGEMTGKPPKDGKKPKPPGDRRQMPEPTGEPSHDRTGEPSRPRPDGNDTSSESKEDRPKPTGDPIGEMTGKPPKDGKKPKPPGDRRQMPEPTGEPSRDRTGEPSNSKPSGEKSGETTGKPPKDGNMGMKKNTLKRLLEMMNFVN